MIWILKEHREKKRVEQARRGQRKKRMKECSGRKALRLVSIKPVPTLEKRAS